MEEGSIGQRKEISSEWNNKNYIEVYGDQRKLHSTQRIAWYMLESTNRIQEQ